MTAFARTQVDLGAEQAIWELRTLNHRYLDLSIRLPEGYRDWEPIVRERAQAWIQRGKLEATLRIVAGEVEPARLELNQELAATLVALSQTVAREYGTVGGLETAQLMQWPGVVVPPRIERETAQEQILDGFESALGQVVAARQREGEVLATSLSERLEGMSERTESIRNRLPEVKSAYRKRLVQRLAELEERLDPERLEQELVFFAQRSDITEELERLEAHLAEAHRVLQTGGVVGRRLDFLMQEMHREANTIGSKSPDTEIVQTVVDLKVLIEQMREQIQNLE